VTSLRAHRTFRARSAADPLSNPCASSPITKARRAIKQAAAVCNTVSCTARHPVRWHRCLGQTAAPPSHPPPPPLAASETATCRSSDSPPGRPKRGTARTPAVNHKDNHRAAGLRRRLAPAAGRPIVHTDTDVERSSCTGTDRTDLLPAVSLPPHLPPATAPPSLVRLTPVARPRVMASHPPAHAASRPPVPPPPPTRAPLPPSGSKSLSQRSAPPPPTAGSMGARSVAHTAGPNVRRRIQCPHCSHTSARADHMAAHDRIHTGEQPYVCAVPGCGRRFRNQSGRSAHYRAAIHRAVLGVSRGGVEKPTRFRPPPPPPHPQPSVEASRRAAGEDNAPQAARHQERAAAPPRPSPPMPSPSRRPMEDVVRRPVAAAAPYARPPGMAPRWVEHSRPYMSARQPIPMPAVRRAPPPHHVGASKNPWEPAARQWGASGSGGNPPRPSSQPWAMDGGGRRPTPPARDDRASGGDGASPPGGRVGPSGGGRGGSVVVMPTLTAAAAPTCLVDATAGAAAAGKTKDVDAKAAIDTSPVTICADDAFDDNPGWKLTPPPRLESRMLPPAGVVAASQSWSLQPDENERACSPNWVEHGPAVAGWDYSHVVAGAGRWSSPPPAEAVPGDAVTAGDGPLEVGTQRPATATWTDSLRVSPPRSVGNASPARADADVRLGLPTGAVPPPTLPEYEQLAFTAAAAPSEGSFPPLWPVPSAGGPSPMGVLPAAASLRGEGPAAGATAFVAQPASPCSNDGDWCSWPPFRCVTPPSLSSPLLPRDSPRAAAAVGVAGLPPVLAAPCLDDASW